MTTRRAGRRPNKDNFGGMPIRVRCSWPLKVIVGLWLPLVPTAVMMLITTLDFDRSRREPWDNAIADQVQGWPVVVLLWLFWWRFAGVSATRGATGIRVRSMWRTYQVSWADLLGVTATERGAIRSAVPS
jgi:hypothetical protein